MLKRKNKEVPVVEEVADLEVPLQPEAPEPVVEEEYEEEVAAPIVAPKVLTKKVVEPEQPLGMRIIGIQLNEDGYVYTVITNKPIGNIGEVITFQ